MTFSQKIEIVSKKGVVLRNRVSRSRKVCVPAKRSMGNQAGEKCKCPGPETSYECAQCTVLLCVAPCFSLYHQDKDYRE